MPLDKPLSRLGVLLAKAAPRTLYVCRPMANAEDLVAWAKGQGFPTTLPAEDLHVTIAYSRTPVDWMKVGQPWEEEIEIPAGGPRLLERLGPTGAARVLLFASDALAWRHQQIREAGASWDWPEYQPHITLSYDEAAPDLASIEPYQGPIVLGAERFAELADGWSDRVVEKQSRWGAGAPGGQGGRFKAGAGGGAFPVKPGAPSTAWSDPGAPGWGASSGMAKPAPLPASARPHPKASDKGQPVQVLYPSKASDPDTWADPARTATFVPGGAAPGVLNGVALSPWRAAPTSAEGWAEVAGQVPHLDADLPFEPSADPKKASIGASVVIQEPDGRIWLTRPTNGFGGYENTFPKGTVEPGLSLQATAIKEAWEETGLKVEITGVLGDYERTTSKARVYLARRVGGTPADMGWESQAIRLAPPSAAMKLLNREIDRGILDDFLLEGAFGKLRAALAKGAKGSGKAGGQQPRWPAGTPLGGQWKAHDGAGLALPPKIGSVANPQYGKKAEAIYGLAKAGDSAGLGAAVQDLEAKLAGFQAKGATSSHVKWNAAVLQYASDLAQGLSAAPAAAATAERIAGPLKLSALTYKSTKPGGSNPGAVYAKDGAAWLVKGNAQFQAGKVSAKQSDDRARNEVLAAKLLQAAGTGAPQMRLLDLEGSHGGTASGKPGSLGVASKMIDGAQKMSLADPAHMAAIRADFAVHAWLGNYDVLGMGYDNTVMKDGQAVCIDPGGALLFRAQGLPKTLGPDASEWETMRTTTAEQQAVYGKMTASQLEASAAKLAGVSDVTIQELVKTHGPGDEKARAKLAATLIARRDVILAKVGLAKAGALAARIAPPEPPIVAAAMPLKGGPIAAPAFQVSVKGAEKVYQTLAAGAAEMHAKGDLEGLKATIAATKVPGTANGKLLAEYHAQLVADLEAKQADAVAEVAAGTATVTDATGQAWTGDGKGVLQPVGTKLQPEAAPPAAAPDFQAQLLPSANQNAAAHNAKVLAIEAAFAAGDESAILALNYSTNTYGKKQAKLANDALAALGSVHQVKSGQLKGSHPALAGGTTQAAATQPQLAPQPAPKAPPPDATPTYRIPRAPDFANWKGPGQGLSSKPAVNAQNQELAAKIEALGKAQDLAGLKAMTFPVLDAAGQPTGATKPIAEHPSQHIKAFHKDVLEAAVTPYVPPKKLSAAELASIPDATKALVALAPKAQSLLQSNARLGRYAILAKGLANPFDGYPPTLVSPQAKNMDVQAAYQASRKAFDALSSVEKQAIKDYTGSGYHAQNNAETGEGNTAASNTIKGLKKAAQPLPPGTVLSRKFTFQKDGAANLQKLLASQGSVVQDFGIISTSTNPAIWSGQVHLKIITTPGVKGLYVAPDPKNGGSAISKHPGENEIILPYGQRFYVRRVEQGKTVKDSTGTWGAGAGATTYVELIALPDVDEE